MDRVLCGMHWSRCLVYLDDVISLDQLSNFGLQLKAKQMYFHADGGGISGPHSWQGWPGM